MVTSDLLSENTYKFLRDQAQVELVPEGSLQEVEADTEEAGKDAAESTESEVTTVEAEVVTDPE